MADYGFNGATVVFNSVSIAKLRDINASTTAAAVDVTGAADAAKTYEGGIPDDTVTLTCVGGTEAIAVNDTGALAITWPDTSTDGTETVAICLERTVAGSLDGEQLTNYTFRQGVA